MEDTIHVSLAGMVGGFKLDVDFAIPMHGISALFGPSGCGKTTILRSIAGLNTVPGTVQVGTDVWQNSRFFLPTHKRSIGYVFQEASLFPHLSVQKNLLYGAHRSKASQTNIEFDEVVDLLGLSRLINRLPTHLSGGERQRVSLGRALLRQPRLLLMDEPLSALDRMAKDEILPYFEALHARLKIPMILVTHDISEVERLADHLVLLQNGRVIASGRLDDVLSAPGSSLSARKDFATVLAGTVCLVENDGIATLEVAGTKIRTVAHSLNVGDVVRVRIAASDVSITRSAAPDTSILNVLPSTVIDVEDVGEHERSIRLKLGAGPAHIRSRISARSVTRLGLKVADNVYAQVKSVSVVASR
ncbi:molybdenum ABC transporter ATP-binding protein [Aureimonas fodinaquatilis]|uniref:Molybdenum ABC transporter ATP-binding protein n=1 Tax=Aureimonas fodinaquatilis TaxID=2565783 RepID=A0A5B0DYN2_9HYPH|nr:molybdenum ABC transporter ATP-binding protein [Aureimonas fodinaquatilis]KAA0970871.1 molybdenum ABC transporter ATP-binding protein [Aureimonas fodinaquatilis]